MVSMVPEGVFFFFFFLLFSLLPHSWLGNYIWDNLGLDYKTDVRSVFSVCHTVIIFYTLPSRTYKCILGIEPRHLSSNRL